LPLQQVPVTWLSKQLSALFFRIDKCGDSFRHYWVGCEQVAESMKDGGFMPVILRMPPITFDIHPKAAYNMLMAYPKAYTFLSSAKLLAGVMLFLPVFASAQSGAVAGSVSEAENPDLRRVQVGMFREAANAERVFNALRDAGLSPVRENHMGGWRVVLPGIDAQRLPSILPILNNAGFHGPWIREEADRSYRVQVGSFREAANAEAALNTLRNAGLNPVYENHMDFRRVILPRVSTRDISAVLNTVYNSGFSDVWLREEPAASQFTIIIQGDAAVTEIQETGSTAPLAIVQTVPSFGVAVTDRTHHASAPIVFFFNNRIYLHSIAPNVEVTADGTPIDGTIVIDEAASGFAILTFTPSNPLPAGREISIVMGQGLQSARGIRMPADVGLSFVTERGAETDFVGNYGFELGETGVAFAGDGAIRAATGSLVPFEGYYYAAISTGSRILSNNVAQNNRSSYIILGPIPEPFYSLSFYYNFVSAEFNEYVWSQFDDTASVTVFGPRGTYSRVITSVNIVETDNMPFTGHPGLPDGGDTYVGYTGWRNFRIEDLDVGSPAYITFTVTDVGDDALSSILAIDAIELGR